jgi:hypothetical protein
MEKIEKQLVGTVEESIYKTSVKFGVRLDKDKVEFLRAISKTRFSGLTKENLINTLNFLKNKDDDWFNEIIEDELAETFSFNTPNSKTKNKSWKGWFITNKGRKVIKDIINS